MSCTGRVKYCASMVVPAINTLSLAHVIHCGLKIDFVCTEYGNIESINPKQGNSILCITLVAYILKLKTFDLYLGSSIQLSFQKSTYFSLFPFQKIKMTYTGNPDSALYITLVYIRTETNELLFIRYEYYSSFFHGNSIYVSSKHTK